jgi:hypothetical protein
LEKLAYLDGNSFENNQRRSQLLADFTTLDQPAQGKTISGGWQTPVREHKLEGKDIISHNDQ